MRLNIIIMLLGAIGFCISTTPLQHGISVIIMLYSMYRIEKRWINEV